MVLCGSAHREIEHHSKQFAFVVIRNAALRTPIIGIAFEPSVQTGFFGRLCPVCGTPLQFSDLAAEEFEITFLIEQTRAQLNHAFGGAGDALTEPQRPREIFLGVVHGFERARADPLHVPEMEKFVRRHRRQNLGAASERVGVQINRGRVSVFHAAAPRPARKMVEKHIRIEGTVVHPTGGGGNDLM